MDYSKNIQMSKDEVDEAIKEYLSIRNVTYNVDEITYITKANGELSRVQIKVR